jgi:hypothetical protein
MPQSKTMLRRTIVTMGKMVEDLKVGEHGYMTMTHRAMSKFGEQLTCVTITHHCHNKKNYGRIVEEDSSKNYRSPAHQDVQTESFFAISILFRADCQAQDTEIKIMCQQSLEFWGLCLPLALAILTRGNSEYMECANKINV